MIIERIPLDGAAVIHAEPVTDHRGTFARFFCERELKDILGKRRIVNVNFSRTKQKGAIRGLHFQYPPKAEMKFIRCICGAVFDVIVDIRKGSPTFLQWFGIVLSADNMLMLCAPEGFAHGFQALEDDSEILYFTTEFYSPKSEGGLNAMDPKLDICWPHQIIERSDKDKSFIMIDESFEGVTL